MNEERLSIQVALTAAELRFLVSCGIDLAQHIPAESLPTYCHFTKEEIPEFSTRMRAELDRRGLDM